MLSDSTFQTAARVCDRILAALITRVLLDTLTPLGTEGAGKTGCALHPRSRVPNAQTKTHTSIQVQRRQSGLPCAMVLTVSFVLSPVTGLVCHRRLRKLPSANLTPASGRQDHTTSPSASASPVSRAAASIASRPYVRDVRVTPLCVGRDARDIDSIWGGGEAESFLSEDWTGQITLIRLNKSGFSRKATNRCYDLRANR